MRNIEDLKVKKQEEFALKYFNKKYQDLSDRNSRFCSYAAEACAYVETIIPSDYYKLNIFDFDGKSLDKREQLIPNSVALKAKDILCDYCWGIMWKEVKNKFDDIEKRKDYLRSHSIIKNRLESGNNVVIFGGYSAAPIGRTMIAAIIMKQAIKLRMKVGRKNETYDWIDFAILKNALIKNLDVVLDWRNCDWLVIDNINYNFESSDKQTAYISELVTPFFVERFNNKLPTVLVFQYDFRDGVYNIERDLGIGIARIVNSKRTFKIPLSQKLDSKREKNIDK